MKAKLAGQKQQQLADRRKSLHSPIVSPIIPPSSSTMVDMNDNENNNENDNNNNNNHNDETNQKNCGESAGENEKCSDSTTTTTTTMTGNSPASTTPLTKRQSLMFDLGTSGGGSGGVYGADFMDQSSGGQLTHVDSDAYSSRWQARSFAIQNLLFSSKFFLCALLVVLIVHFLIWIAVLFIPYSGLSSLRELFAFRYSCVSDIPRSAILGVQIAFYVIVQVVLLLMLYIFRINDRWGVRLEVTLSLVFITVTFFVGLLLTGLGDYMYVNGERHFPAVYYGVVGMVADIVWTCVWPLIQSFFPKNNRQMDLDQNEDPVSLLMEVLEDEEFREIYKEFCASSLTVEPLCFYEDNCDFARSDNTNNRKLLHEARQMIDKYCLDNSPLLLNLPNKKKMLAPIEAKLNEYQQRLNEEASKNKANKERWVDANLFEAINTACIVDMQCDTFVRFKLSRPYQNYLKEKKRLESQKAQFGVH